MKGRNHEVTEKVSHLKIYNVNMIFIEYPLKVKIEKNKNKLLHTKFTLFCKNNPG